MGSSSNLTAPSGWEPGDLTTSQACLRDTDGGWLRPLPALLGELVTKIEDVIDSQAQGLEMRKRAWGKQHDRQNSANRGVW